jgi:pimeloyl-ACP methyl ester carboxylesterase
MAANRNMSTARQVRVLSATVVFAIATLAPRLNWAQGAAGGPNGLPKSALAPRFAPFGTNRVHYLRLGQGSPVLVLIHGWSCNADFWRDQLPALTNKALVLVVDLPGHGESDKPQANYTMDYFAEGVLAVMRDAKVEKATLIGHSMGTPIICRVYAKAPEKVAGLVAVDGFLRMPRMAPEQTERFVSAYRTPEYRDALKRFVAAMFPNAGTEVLRDRTLAEMAETPQHVMRSAIEAMFNADQPDWTLKKVSVPVMALNAQNPMWTADYESYVRGLSSKTEYRALAGVGHFMMLEKPAEFNQALVEMLTRFDLVAK